MPKDEGAGFSLRSHNIERWPAAHAPPFIPTSWSVRLCSALNDVVQVQSHSYPLANRPGEARLKTSGPFRVIHLSLLQTCMPGSCSSVGRTVQASANYLPLPVLQPDPQPTHTRGSSAMGDHSLWVKPVSCRGLVQRMAMETANSILTWTILHGFRRAGPKGQTGSLPCNSLWCNGQNSLEKHFNIF